MIKKIKPPIGVAPRFIKDMERRTELIEVIERYIDAKCPILLEWIVELNEIHTRSQ